MGHSTSAPVVLGQWRRQLITDIRQLGLVRCVVKVLAIMRCHGTSLKELVCVCVYSPQLIWSLSDAPHNHLFTFVVMGHRDVCGCVFGACVQLVPEWSTLEALPYLVGR